LFVSGPTTIADRLLRQNPFAGYGVQSPNTNLLNSRQIGNVVLTASKALPKAPNNINNQ
jgi:hypothetical protein